MWPTLTSLVDGEDLSESARERLRGLCEALQDIFGLRERLNLRDWLEMAWLRLAGPDCVEDSTQLEDAEAFFTMLGQWQAERQHYHPTKLRERIARLFAHSSSADSKLQLMTLHKAKGLEFDWVFIPNLAHPTRGESKSLLLWDEYHYASGESCFLLAMDDEPDSGASSVYSYLYRQRRAKRRSEATRLLYVGATRAIRRLWLSACLDRDDSGDWKAPSGGSLLGTIWSGVEGRVQAMDVPSSQRPGEEGSVGSQRLRLAAPLPCRTADSEDLEGDPNLPAPMSDGFAAAVGSVVHLSLQSLSSAPLPASLDRHALAPWWRRELLALGLGTARLDEAMDRVADSVVKVLADERGRWLLSTERGQAVSEFPLSYLRADGRLAEHVIDRSFVSKGERWAVDYKSTLPDSSQPLEVFLAAEEARYRPQLETYARLLGAAFGQPVRCALYFTALPYWHEIA
jgi:ATP-dependent exoDNAse (exonuclease V) beta subunit